MPASPPLLGSTGSTTLVLAVVLVVLGVVMIAAAIWLVRATRTDLPLLGPLEVMGERRFAKRDPAARAAALSAARPPGAPPPAPMIPIEEDDERPDVEAPAAVGVAPLQAPGPHEVNGHRHVEAQDELAVASRDADGRAVAVDEEVGIAPAAATSSAGGDAFDADEVDAEVTDAEVTAAEVIEEDGGIVEAEVVDGAPDPAAADDAIQDAEIVKAPGHNGDVDGAQVQAAQRAR